MFGNISPFFTNWGPATATQGGILTTSVQSIKGQKTFLDLLTIALGSSDATTLLEVQRISRTGGSGSSGTSGRAALLSFHDASNATLVAAIGGVRDTPNSNFLGSLAFYVNAGSSTSAVSSLTSVVQVSNAGGVTINGGTAPGLTIGSGTKLTQAKVYSQTITPASVAANTTAEQTFTVTGLTTADKVTLNPGAAPTAGTGIVGVRVSAADTLAVTYSNNTAGALTPVSSTCLILATRS